MAKATEIYPSSYRCECGHVSDFFRRTINQMKSMSMKKKVRLGDSAKNEHTIVFYKGEAIEIVCPSEQKAKEPAALEKAPEAPKRAQKRRTKA